LAPFSSTRDTKRDTKARHLILAEVLLPKQVRTGYKGIQKHKYRQEILSRTVRPTEWNEREKAAKNEAKAAQPRIMPSCAPFIPFTIVLPPD
jgi:hypothetical protein